MDAADWDAEMDALPPEVTEDLTGLLQACPAFLGVDQAPLRALAGEAEILYLAHPRPADEVGAAFVVERGGLLVRDAEGRSVDLVGEGEFAAPAADAQLEPVEDALVVVLGEEALDLAWSAPPEQLRAAHATARPVVDLETAGVSAVMSAPVRTIAGDQTCRQAAQRMRAQRISSLVVTGGSEPGLLTDRDLRDVLADARSPETPVSEAASYDLVTIDPRGTLVEALVEMVGAGVHHLPVVADGRLVGMVSATDLVQLRTESPLYLRKRLERAVTVEDVSAVVADVPGAVGALRAAGTAATATARVVAAVTDQVTRTLLRLATEELGDAPAPYAWLAFGSQGRREQTLFSDQDHGLLVHDDADRDALGWFATLGEWMTEAMEQAGFPRCPGGVMASEAAWRVTRTGWRERVAGWLERPGEDELLDAATGMDVRTVAGTFDARAVVDDLMTGAAEREVFLGRLARAAFRHAPPLGFRGRLVVRRGGEDAGTLDMKAGALLPIVDLARVAALAAGSAALETVDRLEAAGAGGTLSSELSGTLAEGFELALGVRLDQHVRQHREGLPGSNRVDPEDLSPLLRSQLREVFKAVQVAQDAGRQRYLTDLLG